MRLLPIATEPSETLDPSVNQRSPQVNYQQESSDDSEAKNVSKGSEKADPYPRSFFHSTRMSTQGKEQEVEDRHEKILREVQCAFPKTR